MSTGPEDEHPRFFSNRLLPSNPTHPTANTPSSKFDYYTRLEILKIDEGILNYLTIIRKAIGSASIFNAGEEEEQAPVSIFQRRVGDKFVYSYIH